MDEGAGLFRDTLRWAMSNNSASVGQKRAPVAINGGVKRKNGGFPIKIENNQESDGEDEKPIRDLQSFDHAKHLWTEKRRRKKMRNMFQELHALLPKQTPKAKLLTIVDDAISYIKNLQHTLQKLETKKLERLNYPSTNTSVTSLVPPQKHLPNASSSTSHSGNASCPKFGPFSFPLRSKPAFQTWASSNVVLNVCGQDALINICSPKKHGLLIAICIVLEKYKLDIVSSHISSDQSKTMFMIHARVNAPDEFLVAYSYEELYKIAALEIMLLVNSKSW